MCSRRIGNYFPAQSSAKSAQFAYSAYGYRSSSQSMLGFDGARVDAATRCYLLGNGRRAFSPSLMRFISPDSMSPFAAGGLNAYVYCLGDPVNRQDPQGTFSFRNAASRLSGRLFPRRANGPGQLKSHGENYKIETTVHTKIEEKFSATINKITVDPAAEIPEGYELIGYHGNRRLEDEKSLLAGLKPRYGRVMWYGHGFYVSPYVKVASTYAEKSGRIYGVYAKDFDKWVHGEHFTLPNMEEMVINKIAYHNVIVRREVKYPIVLSNTFEAYLKSPPDENWRLWSSTNM